MFKSNNILLAGAMAVGVLLAGCTKNEVVDYSAQTGASNYISFLPVSGLSSTKASAAPATSTYYPTDWTFGTFAYNESSTTTAYINNAEVYCTDKDALTNGGEVWTTAKAYLWPKGSTLTFYSYSPYSINSLVTETNYNDGIKIANFDVALNQVDLMVADKVTGQSSNGSNYVYYGGNDGTSNKNKTTYTGVPTIFRHKLAYIAGFNVKTDADYSSENKKEITNDITVYGAQIGETKTTVGSSTITTTTYFQGDFYIDKIEFLNVYTQGTYTYFDDKNNSMTYSSSSTSTTLGGTRDHNGWSSYQNSTTMAWYSPSTGTTNINADGSKKTVIAGPNSSTDDYLYVLPQDFAANTTASKDAAQLKVSFHVSGKYYYVTAKTDNTNTNTTYTVEESETKVVDPKGSYATIDLTKGKDSSNPTTAWNENKKITYDLTLGYKSSGDSGFNIIYWAPNVVAWDEEGWSIDYVNETAGN